MRFNKQGAFIAPSYFFTKQKGGKSMTHSLDAKTQVEIKKVTTQLEELKGSVNSLTHALVMLTHVIQEKGESYATDREVVNQLRDLLIEEDKKRSNSACV